MDTKGSGVIRINDNTSESKINALGLNLKIRIILKRSRAPGLVSSPRAHQPLVHSWWDLPLQVHVWVSCLCTFMWVPATLRMSLELRWPHMWRVPSPAPGLHQDTCKAALPPPGNSLLVPAPNSSVWMKMLFLVVPSRRNACLVSLS